MKKIEQVNLDQAIIDTVLALQDHTENGVTFDLITRGVANLMGAATPLPDKIFEKVEHLLGYDGMLHKEEGGGYYTIDLDAFASEVGIPDFNAKIWCHFNPNIAPGLQDEDLDEYVAHGPMHGGQVEDISGFFLDEDDDPEGELEAVM